MGLCNDSCCNSEKREAIRAEAAADKMRKEQAFEAWLQEKGRQQYRKVEAATEAPDAPVTVNDPNDISYAEALAFAEANLNPKRVDYTQVTFKAYRPDGTTF